uniref:Uncharacterized protein n=1 Tax=Amphimedon queenslandica TaxID=400682 RepID=A0A1X7UDQ2_AMPQE
MIFGSLTLRCCIDKHYLMGDHLWS